jgi:MFS family permease
LRTLALVRSTLTWVLSGAPLERRGRLVGHFGLSMWGGLAAGPPLGAALAAGAGTEAVWWACVAAPVLPALAVLRAPSPSGKLAGRPALLLALASFGYGTLNAFLVLRAGVALVFPVLAALVAGRVRAEHRGAALGAFTSSWDLGLALAGPVGGGLVALFGMRAPFVLAALAVVSGCRRRTRPAPAPEPAVAG